MNLKEFRKNIVVLNKSPKIAIFENFLSIEECHHIINLADGQIARSSVVDNDTGGSVVNPVRTSYSTFLNRGHDEIINAIEFRLATLTEMPVENGEGMQVLHYTHGQEYQPHYDFFDPQYVGSDALLQRGGQRAITVLLYLNDVEEGGETVFPLILDTRTSGKNEIPSSPLKIKPKKGMALLFHNIDISGEPDGKSLHGSKPVIKGEKWVATRWIREHMFF